MRRYAGTYCPQAGLIRRLPAIAAQTAPVATALSAIPLPDRPILPHLRVRSATLR